LATDDVKRQKDWPSKCNVLSGILRRIAPNLRKTGVGVDFDKRDPQTRRKLINLRICGQNIVRTVHTVLAPGNEEYSNGGASVGDRADRSGSFGVGPENPEKGKESNAANHTNAEMPLRSSSAIEADAEVF
jgi:hypothetical protein